MKPDVCGRCNFQVDSKNSQEGTKVFCAYHSTWKDTMDKCENWQDYSYNLSKSERMQIAHEHKAGKQSAESERSTSILIGDKTKYERMKHWLENKWWWILAIILVGLFPLLKTQWESVEFVREKISGSQPAALKPQEEKLLRLIYDQQRALGLPKLIIGREGQIYYETEELRKKRQINLLSELFNTSDSITRSGEFELILNSIPTQYLRQIPETRWENPYVVTVTSEGISYLQRNAEE